MFGYYCKIYKTGVGVMKMGNTVPRVRLEPTFLAFQASEITFHRPVSEVSADYYNIDTICAYSTAVRILALQSIEM